MILNMVLQELAEREAREWNTDAAFPAMWEIMHQCESANLDIRNTETIINWYVFFKKNNAATLEEFTQKFAESAKKRDFYEFSKYCITLYRKVHEQKLAVENDPFWRAFIEKRMVGAVSRDQFGDQCHDDPKNDYWQRRASIVGPEDRELPRAHVRLLEAHRDIGELMAAHKKFDKTNGQISSTVNTGTNEISHAIQDALSE